MKESKIIPYRQLQQELDDLLFEIQADNIDIDSVIIKYDEAQKLIKQLESRLKEAENKIKSVVADSSSNSSKTDF